MGEVYRARDTKLNRDVAIKVLPDLFANDAERLARFTREAQTLAALNHPNIAHIHGLEESSGVRALVMELVEGEELSHRMARGAVPLDEALAIARQIADALEAAHERAIIHRDLKPANIKVRPDGAVKVLDFGLAKALEPVGGAPGASQSPTITAPVMTQTGIILGTAAYMCPEQARGKPVDRRADIWAFGVVLFEMLTGRRLFAGKTISETLVSVLMTEPDWRALPAAVPSSIRGLLRRCLNKDPKQRLRDIGDARVQIEEVLAGAPEDTGAAVIADTVPMWRRALPWASTGALAAGLTVVLVLWALGQKGARPAPVRLSAELGADVSLRQDLGSAAVLSPNGETLVFASETTSVPAMLYVRSLDQLTAKALAGTEDAINPFFSPDNQWIGFFAGGKLRRISVKGGTALTVCDAPGRGNGGSWHEDGSIVFGHGATPVLLRVSSAGGTPEPLTSLVDGEISHRWPQILPANRGVLYTSNTSDNWDDARIMVQPLPSGVPKLVQPGFHGRYAPSGHLLYVRGGTLYAAPFDLDRLQVTGPSVSAVEGVVAGVNTGGAQFSASDTGTLVFLQGQGYSAAAPMALMDRAGNTELLRSTRVDWGNPRFSPDGKHLAVDISDGKQTDIWVKDLTTSKMWRVTFDGADDYHPTWTPDGRRIAFTSTRDGAPNIYWQRADGAGEAERLTRSPHLQTAASWHPSGRSLAIQEESPRTGSDVMILSLDAPAIASGARVPTTVFAAGPFNEAQPAFSPDGRWVAYQSNETGHAEVFVRSVHAPGGKWQVSSDGGRDATWSRTKPELVYLGTTQDRIMVAPFTVTADSFQAEGARPWSNALVDRPVRRGRKFDLHPDGERVVIVPAERQKADHITIVFNFFDALQRIAPVSK
jgi:serine/threonine-protein kinase